MQTITLMDKSDVGALSFDLRDLLACVASVARQLKWRIGQLECIGNYANELEELAARGLVEGEKLIALADGIDQVVDGEFFGYEHGSESPALVFRAVDSSSWDVAATSENLFNAFRRRYVAVIEVGEIPT
jgi:hypothetical protein